jgi:hypothetical protein
MQNATVVKAGPVGRVALIVHTVIAVAVLIYFFYRFENDYGITWPEVGWTLSLAALMLAIVYLKYRKRPLLRQVERPRPGVLTLTILISIFPWVYLSSIPHSRELLDAFLAVVWPLLLGAVLGWFGGMLYFLFRPQS